MGAKEFTLLLVEFTSSEEASITHQANLKSITPMSLARVRLTHEKFHPYGGRMALA